MYTPLRHRWKKARPVSRLAEFDQVVFRLLVRASGRIVGRLPTYPRVVPHCARPVGVAVEGIRWHNFPGFPGYLDNSAAVGELTDALGWPHMADCLAACHNFGSRSDRNGRRGETAQKNYPRKERNQISHDHERKFFRPFSTW